ncbi:arginine-glutamic acid dipeptide repeats protein [Striga asiatica]|uniref:Arginine-glutamic acid dipeptide repeats protein n=1 Tax=Striga asiatica TaxID=4170 RepID=A0A5A7R0M2_STRAF|nr:arginine-glutamic acid dipeptide repeats protein [Striga asiatica]
MCFSLMASTSYSSRGCIDNIPSEILMPESDVFGEPNSSPRIGNEHQAELPSINKKSNYMYKSTYYGDTHPKHVIIGLPIPLVWMNNNGPDKNSEMTLTNSVQDTVMKPEENSQAEEERMQKLCGEIVPGLTEKFWSDAEKASFFLGLHIFEKNFVDLGHFVETKNSGDVMAYYYGEFYHSKEYFRWSERRTAKGRKRYVFGQRIFSGLRQQELISRLVARVPDECKSALLEVSKTFSDEKSSLSSYLSSLKSMVGITALTEAISLGKGKKDMTRMALEPSGSNNTIQAQTTQVIPSRKKCSSLSPSEIIEILNGDCRLSKARSHELFWEAVWPRLLERGWSSRKVEYGKGDVFNVLDYSVIYLTPGSDKLPDDEIVKGDHYFTSSTDVLGRVSREPILILLGSDNDEVNNGPAVVAREERDEEEEFYLQPRAQNRSLHAVKYTVVDTCPGGNLRDVRYLPCEEDENGGPGLENGKGPIDDDDDEASLENVKGPSDGEPGLEKREEEEEEGQTLTTPEDGNKSGRIQKGKKIRGGARRKAARKRGETGGDVICSPGRVLMGLGMENGPVPSGPNSDVQEGPVEKSRCPLPFDLNEPPVEEAEEEEEDLDVNTNAVRQSRRGLQWSAKALENLVDELADRKRKGIIDEEGFVWRPTRRVRTGVLRGSVGCSGDGNGASGSGDRNVENGV